MCWLPENRVPGALSFTDLVLIARYAHFGRYLHICVVGMALVRRIAKSATFFDSSWQVHWTLFIFLAGLAFVEDVALKCWQARIEI